MHYLLYRHSPVSLINLCGSLDFESIRFRNMTILLIISIDFSSSHAGPTFWFWGWVAVGQAVLAAVHGTRA